MTTPGCPVTPVTNSPTPIVSISLTNARDSYLGPLGMDATAHSTYIPSASLHPSMNADFKGFPKTFIVAGRGLAGSNTHFEGMLKDLIWVKRV
jgi:hypothetical protein